MIFEGKRILITGGTGSLGKVLVKRLLSGEHGTPAKVTIFSRDEAKQHDMRVSYMKKAAVTDEVIYNNFSRLIEFRIGDVRKLDALIPAVQHADIVINAAALKQVPSCEYFPSEAVDTNIHGAENIVRAIRDYHAPVETVVCISTDKACKPVNVMGMTKALQEKIMLRAGLNFPGTRFVGVRYGNVLASRGSVIPLFHNMIRNNLTLTITHPDTTRFLLSLHQAVDIVFEAINSALDGEIYIPIIPTAKVTDIAEILLNGRDLGTEIIGLRPGEKLHEVMISEDEAQRAFKRNGYYVIPSTLPELHQNVFESQETLNTEYSSEHNLMTLDEVRDLLVTNKLMIEDNPDNGEELIR